VHHDLLTCVARPRRDEQQVLLERIAVAVHERQSLEPWTLAEIAPAAGLSPAGLLKRFGSRQGILAALSRRWIDSIPDSPGGQAAPDSELRRWVERRFSPDGPERVAQGLVNLLDDLMDDQLRGLLAEGWAKEIRYLTALLARARLPGLCDPSRGACLLFDALNGAMLRYATDPAAPSPTQTLDDLMETWT
jgi:AcrR family transcriptional regulator